MPRDDDDRWSRDDADGRPRPRRRVWDEYDPEDDFDDRPRGRRRRDSGSAPVVLGAVSLTLGVLALPMSFGCGGIGLAPGVIGVGLGILGFLFAHQRRDRRARVLPACGAAVSALAILLSVIALASFVRTMREAERESQAETEKADRERLKAADEVRAAAAGGATRVTAGRFAKAYDDDEDRADRLYKNKVLEITGVVDELDFTGETYSVHLRAGRDLTATCEFAKAPDVRARLARLKPGDQVTIRGKCLGGEAAIEACVLVE